MISLLTPTGDRPEAFELCRKWMSSQTMSFDQWLVVDDGFTPMPESLKKGLDYIRRVPVEGEGHTITKNFKTLLPFIKGDKILIIEDDDWYGPAYIKTMHNYLNKHHLVGEGYARYYLVPTMKYFRVSNLFHASLCQTGFTSSLLNIFRQCLEGDPYIDGRFWEAVKEHKHIFVDKEDRLKLHCSTKGLRGRKGIGTGHNSKARYYRVDNGLSQLINWVGPENAKIYMKHVGQSFESALLTGSGPQKRKLSGVVKRRASVRRVPIKEVSKEKDITVITITGDRPICFDLLRKWMSVQTVKPDQWIVIDDGKIPIKEHREFEYHRRLPTTNDYLHTLCLNLPIALDKVRNGKIIIMEDDDWYSPIYIEYMSKLLDCSDLVGFKNLIFYYPSLGMYMKKDSAKQPALAQTAFRGKIIPIIKGICSTATKDHDLCGKGLVDVKLWKHPLSCFKKEESVRLTSSLKTARGSIVPFGTIFSAPIPRGILKRAQRKQGAVLFYTDVPDTAIKTTTVCTEYLTVGMKGMPGRKGQTTAHDPNNKKYKKDEGYNLLKSIIKKDIDFYLELFA
jgi:hypothetical protein